MPPLLDDAEHSRSRAEEARTNADQMKDPVARGMMLDIAKNHDALAERADQRRKSKSDT